MAEPKWQINLRNKLEALFIEIKIESAVNRQKVHPIHDLINLNGRFPNSFRLASIRRIEHFERLRPGESMLHLRDERIKSIERIKEILQ